MTDGFYEEAAPALSAVEWEQVPDGVYLDMTPEEYFAQDALGSSDLIDLAARGRGWWWKSRLNKLRKVAPSTTEQTYGSALHAIMLEGTAAYEAQFAVLPDKADYPNLLEKTEHIKAALTNCGRWTPPVGTSKWVKEQWVAEGAAYLDQPIWANVLEAYDQARGTKRSITRTDDAMLRIMRDAAVDTSTPEGQEIAHLLGEDSPHPPLAEVSIFWTDRRGLRRRARLDRTYPAFDLDLKSLRGNWRGESLVNSLDDLIRGAGYDIQRADYFEARRRMYAFIVAGMDNVAGGTLAQRAWLAQFPDIAPSWDWLWLFYQKPDMVEGIAPVLFPVMDDYRSPYHVNGLRKGQRALELYSECMATIGPDKPWCKIESLHYTDENLLPHIMLHPDNNPAAQAKLDDEADFIGADPHQQGA